MSYSVSQSHKQSWVDYQTSKFFEEGDARQSFVVAPMDRFRKGSNKNIKDAKREEQIVKEMSYEVSCTLGKLLKLAEQGELEEEEERYTVAEMNDHVLTVVNDFLNTLETKVERQTYPWFQIEYSASAKIEAALGRKDYFQTHRSTTLCSVQCSCEQDQEPDRCQKTGTGTRAKNTIKGQLRGVHATGET